MIILGARPQFIKSAPIVHELLKTRDVKLQLINSGQHYDYELSQIFFEEMKLPVPLLDLRVGSGSHAVQTAKAMIRLERCMLRAKPDVVLVPGDTNTTLAAALAAVKLCLPVAHVEAGARSHDISMPEEINRRLTDHASSILFAPTKIAAQNLYAEGIPKERVHLVGDTMVDALLAALPAALKLRNKILSELDAAERKYILVTAHRSGNVDEPHRLKSIVKALRETSKQIKIVFPAHPRILNKLKAFRLLRPLRECRSLVLIKPVGYLELVALLDNATAVLTDSGGLQKEAFLLGVPCATMRDTTEWTETVQAGANVLVDVDRTKIVDAIVTAMKNEGRRNKPIYSDNPFGDGKASGRLVDVLVRQDARYQYNDRGPDKTNLKH
jgi:UDP-N-acetylglucosamine 2-epimerase